MSEFEKLDQVIEGLLKNNLKCNFIARELVLPKGSGDYAPLVKRAVPPGASVNLDFPSPIKRAMWNGQIVNDYIEASYYWLAEMEDGRFAFFANQDWGTCEGCGSSLDSAAFGQTLADVIKFGMSDTERKLLGL